MQNTKATTGKMNANILIIEDDPDITEIMSMLLIEQGYGVRSVNNRKDALKILDSYLYDLIIMDLVMIGMEPEFFLKKARQNSPNAKVILISGHEDVETYAGKYQVNAFMRKPFMPEELVAVIEKCSKSR